MENGGDETEYYQSYMKLGLPLNSSVSLNEFFVYLLVCLKMKKKICRLITFLPISAVIATSEPASSCHRCLSSVIRKAYLS